MKSKQIMTRIPPYLLIGTIIVLFPIFAYMTLDRIHVHKAQGVRLLFEKGTALIKAFEAGTRTGMMNMRWGKNSLEILLQETALLPDISYLAIVSLSGSILIHSAAEKNNSDYGQDLDLDQVLNSEQALWRIITDENHNKVFEVYKKFSPVARANLINPPGVMAMHQRMHGLTDGTGIDYDNAVIFVGLDMTVVEQANQNDIQHSIIMAITLLLIGVAGFVLLFIVQRYRAARSSLSRIQIFSDTLVENMPVGLIAVDHNDQVLSVNPAAEKLLNPALPANNETEAKQVLPESLMQLLQSIHQQDTPIEKEIRIRQDNRARVILDVLASPLKDKNGISYGSLLILRDLTELSLLKDEIQTNKRLAAIGRLAAGVAHEIRNPLSSLKGYATFFKEVFDKDTQNFDIAQTMINEVDRLNRVVGELVEIAKPVTVSGKPVLIRDLVADSLKIIEHEADLRHIVIETDMDDTIGYIHADEDRMKQVLINLYLNAVQSMEDSGRLRVGISRDISSQKILITVSDTGCGIKKEDLPDIFEPYFTTKLSGTGLGLAIVHNIVRAHKGEVTVKSEPEKGTVFTIILPDGENNSHE